MAERVGFEPTIPVKVCPLSRRIVSTTHAPLRVGKTSCRSSVLKTSGHLPAIAEEALQHLYATAGEDASFDLHAVVQLRVVEHLQN